MIRYHRPATLTEALAIRAGGDVAILAGATDIYPAAANRRAWGDPTHKDVLDITAVAGLRDIAEGAHGWRLGCLVTWSDIGRAPLPKQFDGLRQAARQVGGVQVQNRGTILGNLVTASPAGDGIPNLLALN
ncbi:MAG: FAD binding domain-containing protein, partial [Roseomonas sp.]|nr:FAD binding domain-containing protein [Roseomonas sp.]